MKLVRLYIWVAATLVLAIIPLQYVVPRLSTYVRKEDSWVENLSAMFFLAAFLLALALWRRTHTRRREMLAIGVVGLLGFLDEVSYGERLFRAPMPVVEGVKLDGIHDLISVTHRVLYRASWERRALLLSIGVILLAGAFWGMRRFLPSLGTWLPAFVPTPHSSSSPRRCCK